MLAPNSGGLPIAFGADSLRRPMAASSPIPLPCSAHRSPRARSAAAARRSHHAPARPLAGLLSRLWLVPLLAFGLAGCSGDAGQGGGQRPPTPVVVSTPFEREFADRLEAIGTAYANESVVLTARVTQQVGRVLMSDGQTVTAGEVLVELVDGEERAQLAQARATRADAKLRFDRVADLASRGTESQSRFDEVRTALDAANARVEELEAKLAGR